MLIKKPDDIASSEITPQHIYVNRRKFMTGAAAAAGALVAGKYALDLLSPEQKVEANSKLQYGKSSLSTSEKQTPYKYVTTYNNYYEFGVDKGEPAENAGTLKTRPWTIVVEGLVKKPKTFDIDALMKLAPMEERVYRHRCVEAWSMVIPWVGYSLATFIDKCEPLGKAKYVQFITKYDPKEMPLAGGVLDWPYREGLRLDEARNPLALLGFGLYGETLPNQNGAPVRIVLPWKYGFKSCKSIVKVRFLENQPETTWNMSGPGEYGFYSNVNPTVDHPRWSQATERPIGENSLFVRRKQTLMFNGYGDQVAGMYAGMDLKKNF